MIYALDVVSRKKQDQIRPEGIIPAVIYGPEVKENILLHVNAVKFQKLYDEAGESSLINLTVDGEKEPKEVLIKQVDMDPVKNKVLHIDFYQIIRGQKLEVEVELKFVGEAPAEKGLGGVLVTNLDSIKVRCLPKDMISEVEVDLGQLKTFDDRIQVKDIVFPESFEVQVDLDDSVALVAPPRLEEVTEKPVEAVVEEAEVEADKKTEEKATDEKKS